MELTGGILWNHTKVVSGKGVFLYNSVSGV